MNAQLKALGWSVGAPIAQDGSSRRYFRMVRGESESAILMHCLAPKEAGNALSDFVRLDQWLRSVGMNAPEIYEQGHDWILIEDFGDISFKGAIEQGVEPEDIYALAHDVLQEFQSCDETLPILPRYQDSRAHQWCRLILDYYYPFVTGEVATKQMQQRYMDVWRDIESTLAPCPHGFTHTDYHLENLMYLPDRVGLQRCGIIDFQGATYGPLPYDLVNLLEDARMDVALSIRKSILALYDDNFQGWYRILGTQFHCRLMGQFMKMVGAGKPHFLKYLPRVHVYLVQALKNPLLHPLSTFFSDLGLDFSDGKALNIQRIENYISSSAFQKLDGTKNKK